LRSSGSRSQARRLSKKTGKRELSTSMVRKSARAIPTGGVVPVRGNSDVRITPKSCYPCAAASDTRFDVYNGTRTEPVAIQLLFAAIRMRNSGLAHAGRLPRVPINSASPSGLSGTVAVSWID
jgi:hypothetical protein